MAIAELPLVQVLRQIEMENGEIEVELLYETDDLDAAETYCDIKNDDLAAGGIPTAHCFYFTSEGR